MKGWIRQVSRVLLALGFLAAGAAGASAQVTTGSVTGRVTGANGEPISGASISITNERTGLRQAATTRANGQFFVPNLDPGPRYRVTARAIGFRPQTSEDVRVPLGSSVTVDFALEAAAIELQEVVSTADPLQADFNAARTGAQTVISDSSVARLPTLDRQFTDFARLTPQVSARDADGISALGQNNRYNAIQLDGSTINDRFALGSTGLAGGQADGRQVGIEAVKEFQILLAPYDVRQSGFTGALINAVTKSGTNKLTGSLFGFYRENGLSGDPLGLSDYSNRQFGGSLGGPIVKDKIHFFVNADLRRGQQVATGPFFGQSPTLPAVPFDSSSFNRFANALGSRGLAVGNLDRIENERPLSNLFGRLDFTLGASRLVLSYSYNQAEQDIFSRSQTGTINLSSQSYFFRSRNHVPRLQFFTNWKSGASNELLVSYNRIRDRRTPSVIAPAVTVAGIPVAAGAGTGTYSLRAGSEQFSMGNELDQDIVEVTDNLSWFWGNHRITVGARGEYYRFRNLFAQSSFGVWSFANLAALEAGTPNAFSVSGPLTSRAIDEPVTAYQLGGYIQDQWQASNRLSITAGLRVDAPIFPDDPRYADQVLLDFPEYQSEAIPSGQLLWAPRIGFNWDADGRGGNQVRGGVGIFTGNPGFVWYANAFQNNGTGLGFLTCRAAEGIPAFPAQLDAANPPRACGNGLSIAPGSVIGGVDFIAPGTKFPQVLRGSLAWDRRLPGNAVLSFEGIVTKSINEFFIVNRNLQDTPVGVDPVTGRALYGTVGTNGSPTATVRFQSPLRYGNAGDNGVWEVRNTDAPWSFAITPTIRKTFSRGFEGSLSYTYSEAYDVASFTSSRAPSNFVFGRVYSGSQYTDNATRSAFDRPHRIVANATYTFPWRSFPTDISFTYIGQSGQPYTLTAGGSGPFNSGDLNRDGRVGNDPIYIPRDARNTAEMEFVATTGANALSAAQQADIFNAYISGEACLEKQRGRIMERNTCRNPWQNFLDVTVRQSIPRVAGQTLTFELGVFNLLNLIDSDWGQIRTVDGGAFFAPTALEVVDAPAGRERFRLANNVRRPNGRFVTSNAIGNSYQIQLSARYSF